MAFIQWRRFNFFDRDVVKDPEGRKPFDKLKEVDVTCSASGRGQLVIGDSEGNVFFVNKQMNVTGFKAYSLRCTHMQQLRQNNLLITVGEDDPGVNPQIKVWNLDKLDQYDAPLCTRTVRALPSNVQPSPMTCVAVHENLNLIAAGFENGSVMLYKGDITRNSTGKIRTLHECPRAVTGLAWRPSSRQQVLFFTTEFSVMSVCLGAKDKDTKELLDRHGCEPRCCVMSDSSQESQFVIGRQDAVYFYEPTERGPCLAFEGAKVSLHWFRSCLVVVTREPRTIAKTPGMQGVEMNIVNVYDIQNKLLAYSAPVPRVSDILCEWGVLYILSADGKLYQLREKDTQSKLDLLFRKNLYQLAITLAKGQQYDQDGLVDIFRQYGDHLYGKGDYDGAIAQYIKTIDKLEASYVIRKFLDPQRVHNLTQYLEELHRSHLASEEHTTLLLSCYSKLQDTHKLDEFVLNPDNEVTFDVDTAIRVCRQGGFFSQALAVARKHKRHSAFLKVQLEDLNDCPSALEYIANLPFEEAEQSLLLYGKQLMTAAPRETTRLLKLLCTDYKPRDAPLVDAPALTGAAGKPQRAAAEDFIHVFVDNAADLCDFLTDIVKVQPQSPSVLYNTLLELNLQGITHETDITAKVEKERKTLELLQSPECGYDVDHALVLCQMAGFKAGILYLYERAHLFHQILRYHMQHDEYLHIIETCKKFGALDSGLWLQALSYFAGRDDDCKAQVAEILQFIDRKNLIPPLLVVQTLAQSRHATLGLVKDYLVRRLENEQQQISEDEQSIKQHKQETSKMKQRIHELETSATVFQVSKCGICSHPLELPSLHFLCGHSFHQHCFESYCEVETQCVACAREHGALRDLLAARAHQASDAFHVQLERATDGFRVAADFFARGLFNQTPKEKRNPTKKPSSLNPFD